MTEIRTAIPEEVDAYLDALVQKGVFSNKAELVRAALVSYVNVTGTFFRGFDAENVFAPDGRLYQGEDASGAAVETFGAGVGRGATAARELLESRYRKMRLSDAERLLVDLFGRETPIESLRVGT